MDRFRELRLWVMQLEGKKDEDPVELGSSFGHDKSTLLPSKGSTVSVQSSVSKKMGVCKTMNVCSMNVVASHVVLNIRVRTSSTKPSSH